LNISYRITQKPQRMHSNWPAFCWSRDLAGIARSSQMLSRHPTVPVRRRRRGPRAARTATALCLDRRQRATTLYHNWFWTADDIEDDNDDDADDDEADPDGRRRRRSRGAGRSPRCRKRSAAACWSAAAATADWPAGRHESMTARGAGVGWGPGRTRQMRRHGPATTSKTEELGSDDECLAAEQLWRPAWPGRQRQGTSPAHGRISRVLSRLTVQYFTGVDEDLASTERLLATTTYLIKHITRPCRYYDVLRNSQVLSALRLYNIGDHAFIARM